MCTMSLANDAAMRLSSSADRQHGYGWATGRLLSSPESITPGRCQISARAQSFPTLRNRWQLWA